MTAYERAILEARRRLAGIDDRAANAISAAYQEVARRLARNLDALTARIDAEPGEVSVEWLRRQGAYLALLDGLAQDLAEFAGAASRHIDVGQQQAATAANGDAVVLAVEAMGPGPGRGVQMIRAGFPDLPPEPPAGRSITGAPVGLLLLALVPQTQDRVRQALDQGVSLGIAPQELSSWVTEEAAAVVPQAQSVSRTEIMAAYNNQADANYQQSQVVTGWQWYATLNERSCAVCLAMHGSIHPLGEPLESHISCRCTKRPLVPSWAELGFTGVPDRRPTIETGSEAFARLTRPEKLAIVGPGKLALLEAGRITLSDLVVRTTSGAYGPGRRVATLRELEARA